MKKTISLFLLLVLISPTQSADIPETVAKSSVFPDFGTNVFIFDSSMSMDVVQKKCDIIFEQQEKSQFGKNRYAFLFKPGQYNVDVNVGYYTQVCGLGLLPDDVIIKGAVRSEGDWSRGNVTQNFWRACENLAIIPTENNITPP